MSSEIFGKIFAHKCDISNSASVNEAFKWIESQFGSISILVNNAATAHSIKILGERDDVTKKIIEAVSTNFTGVVQCTRKAARLMKKSKEHSMIVNINDTCGRYIPFLEEESINAYAPT